MDSLISSLYYNKAFKGSEQVRFVKMLYGLYYLIFVIAKQYLYNNNKHLKGLRKNVQVFLC